jgi:thiol:disulfide interchange protein
MGHIFVGRTCFRQQNKEDWIMPSTQVVMVLIVVGVVLWLINRFIPMAGSIKSILNAVVVIAVVLWLLSVFGLLSSLSKIHVGK